MYMDVVPVRANTSRITSTCQILRTPHRVCNFWKNRLTDILEGPQAGYSDQGEKALISNAIRPQRMEVDYVNVSQAK